MARICGHMEWHMEFLSQKMIIWEWLKKETNQAIPNQFISWQLIWLYITSNHSQSVYHMAMVLWHIIWHLSARPQNACKKPPCESVHWMFCQSLSLSFLDFLASNRRDVDVGSEEVYRTGDYGLYHELDWRFQFQVFPHSILRPLRLGRMTWVFSLS